MAQASLDTKSQKKEKPKYSIPSNIAFMVKRAWNGHKPVLLICLLIAFFTFSKTVIEMLIAPMILQVVERGGGVFELVLRIVVFVICMLITNGTLEYLNTYSLFGRVAVRSTIVVDIEKKNCTTSYPNLFDTKYREYGKRAGEAVGSNSQASEAIWATLEGLLANIFGFVFYLILISNLDIRIAAVVTVLTVIGFAVNSKLGEWDYAHRQERAEIVNKMYYSNEVLEDNRYAKEIRIFGITDWANDLWEKNKKLIYNLSFQKQKRYFIGNILDIVLTFLKNAVAYAVLISMVLGSKISVSEFLLYFAAVSGYSAWVGGILERILTLKRQSLDLSIIREFLEWEEPFKFEGGKEIPAAPYVFELKNVSFRYPEADKDTIADMNLRIEPEEKIAVVGLNGAGKTTLVKLLAGFLDPTSGQVLLNGIDIREFNRRDYYDIFSAVFQEFSIIPASIQENVTQTLSVVDKNKLDKSLSQAGLLDKIRSLPAGAASQITRKVYEDGLELSGGETQRLMLARVLYKDSPVVILDEPTAALDPIAENNIYLKYNEMTKGKQSIFISHRLASTRFCDRILYLENGKIAEEGTHEELMNAGGKYAEIYDVQSKYYREDVDHEETDIDEDSFIA